jgi:hypothetical protein
MIPKAFKPYRQFIIYQLIALSDGKLKKIPTHPRTFQPCNAHDPALHMDWATALDFVQHGFGVGFVFTDRDPFFFIDIDDALQADGSWSQLAQDLCTLFAGSYVEISVSGTGLHIFGSGTYKAHGCTCKSAGLEFYTNLKFAALTGTGAQGCAGHIHQAGINWLIDNYFPAPVPTESGDWTIRPVPEWDGVEDDREIIERMLASRSGMAVLGGKASVQSLWSVDVEQLCRFFPSPSGNLFDHSGADGALCSHLAFWTGKNCERIDRLFRQSGLMRDKWDRRDGTYGTYGRRTIQKAVGFCKKVYGEGNDQATTALFEEGNNQPPIDTYREGFQFLTVTDQVTLFQGCTYVQDLHKIFTPTGCFLKPDQFKAMYGGYVFALDSINDKTTRKAWEAFTESQGYNFPKVHGTCFRPELPAGHIISEEGRSLINTYVPINTGRRQGDITPFLSHMALMLPNETDRTILLSYISACVQYPGVKFQWAPLIQGIQGNGKTLIISAVSYAIGHRYTHLPNASDLGSNGQKFNQWIQNKLLIGVEEIYVSDRREVSEALKPLITNPRIEIQGKGDNQITGDNRANFIICSNHKDAVLKTLTDRRYCVFYTAQQDIDDMKAAGWITRDGMPTRYFVDLYNWLKKDGYSYVNEFLHNYQIPVMYNPALDCHRAPVTSSTGEAVGLSLGGVEQEIIELVGRGAQGFANGWISSLALDRMLKTRRDDKRITYNKRAELLKNMGYVPHPALKNGRVNNIIPMDLGKPRLYIKKGHIVANMTNSAEIAKRYVQDQGMSIDVHHDRIRRSSP